MIHCIYNAYFADIDGDVPGKCVVGYVFSLPGGDSLHYTQPIRAIWEDGGELFVEDKAGSTYQIADFYSDESAHQLGCMREEIFQGFFR